jgi:hypothetical protein
MAMFFQRRDGILGIGTNTMKSQRTDSLHGIKNSILELEKGDGTCFGCWYVPHAALEFVLLRLDMISSMI